VSAVGWVERDQGGPGPIERDQGGPGPTDRAGWLDCSSGVSGDMLLGALVSAGVPVTVLQEAVDAAVPEPVELAVEPVQRAGLAATRVHVRAADSATHRTWSDVRRLLERADLPDGVRTSAMRTFRRLAEAEAAVHGTAAEQVQFHEVGALDAVADVVGVSAGLAHLRLDALVCSPVAVGGGTVGAAHGRLPAPVPAVVVLLTGAPTLGGPTDTEHTTPTGAALLATHATAWGRQPAMTVTAAGTGAGGRDHAGVPNVVRLLVGHRTEPPASEDSAVLLTTNVDDLDPRLWPPVLARLLDAGASDAWLTPVLMKKGRPAHTLSVLLTPHHRAAVLRALFTQTSTLGLREQVVGKVALARQEAAVDVDGQRVRVKLAWYEGAVVNAQPEYEDVAAAALALDRPVKVLLAQAVAAAAPLWGADPDTGHH
jgi:uncharacterized protein (TIGR00299 family) protein